VVLKSSSSATKNTVFRAVQKLRRALQPLCGNKSTKRAQWETEIMKHMTEEELIAYREGVAEQRALIHNIWRL